MAWPALPGKLAGGGGGIWTARLLMLGIFAALAGLVRVAMRTRPEGEA